MGVVAQGLVIPYTWCSTKITDNNGLSSPDDKMKTHIVININDKCDSEPTFIFDLFIKYLALIIIIILFLNLKNEKYSVLLVLQKRNWLRILAMPFRTLNSFFKISITFFFSRKKKHYTKIFIECVFSLKSTGHRPFQCTTCLKTFSQKCALNLHILSHTAGIVTTHIFLTKYTFH